MWDQASLDYEANRRVHLVVLADGGPMRTAHCRVTVMLQDVNDNAPAFEQGHYRTAVWEGQVHNTYVMQVWIGGQPIELLLCHFELRQKHNLSLPISFF